VKLYQAVRIAEEIQTLRERAAVMLYVHCQSCLYNVCRLLFVPHCCGRDTPYSFLTSYRHVTHNVKGYLRVVTCDISGFPVGVVKVFALLECYAAWCSSWLPTFRDSLSVRSSRVNQFKRFIFGLHGLGPISPPETSVTNYQPTLRNV
jgi:hypothetical protein